MPGKRLKGIYAVAASIGLVMLTLSGCQFNGAAHTTRESSPVGTAAADRPYTGTVADWPLFFRHHNFGVACFDTQSCNVVYHRFQFGTDRPTSPATSFTPEQYNSIMRAGYGPVPRNTPPAKVVWRTKEGAAMQAEIDIGEIFKDGKVWHHVRREEIPEGISMGSTHIILEVDYRTINVYTRTMIPLKQPSIPGNPYSYFRSDLIKVYSRTY